MIGRLDGKVAIVSGASYGIGKTTAKMLAEEGAKVAVAPRTVDAGEASADVIKESGGEAIFIRADVSNPDDVAGLVKTAVDTYGRLDILFNNAGIQGELSPLAALPVTTYDRFLDINTRGTWLGMKYAIPEMIKTGAAQ